MNNVPVVSVEDFIKIIKLQIEENNKRPVFGLGKGGIGKSEAICNLAKELNIGYIDIRLLLYNETDLKGIPYPNENHTKTIWLENNILPNIERDGNRGILVLDEITSCSKSVRTAAYQLLNERALGEYKLPDGWLIVCLGNGEEDGGDYQGMEGNFANRCSIFNIVTNLDVWKKWALSNNIHELVTAYLSFKPTHLHTFQIDSESEILFASPRSWKAVSDILNNCNISLLQSDHITKLRINSNIGNLVGQQFIAFTKFKESAPSIDLIMSTGKCDNNLSNEVIIILVHEISKELSRIIKDDMVKYNGIQQSSLNRLVNSLNWILSLPKEYAVMSFKDLVNYDDVFKRLIIHPNLLESCPMLTKFASDNSEIFK